MEKVVGGWLERQKAGTDGRAAGEALKGKMKGGGCRQVWQGGAGGRAGAISVRLGQPTILHPRRRRGPRRLEGGFSHLHYSHRPLWFVLGFWPVRERGTGEGTAGLRASHGVIIPIVPCGLCWGFCPGEGGGSGGGGGSHWLQDGHLFVTSVPHPLRSKMKVDI
jgi:hypothetical protein